MTDDIAGIPIQEHLENAPDYGGFVFLNNQSAFLRPVSVNLAASGCATLILLADAPLAVF